MTDPGHITHEQLHRAKEALLAERDILRSETQRMAERGRAINSSVAAIDFQLRTLAGNYDEPDVDPPSPAAA